MSQSPEEFTWRRCSNVREGGQGQGGLTGWRTLRKVLSLTLSFQETWLYLLQIVGSGNTTPTPKNTCPSETTSATGKSTFRETTPLHGAVSISKTGICAGKGAWSTGHSTAFQF